MEVAAGYCEFINNIPASKKAADLNPETRMHAAHDVIFHHTAAEQLGEVVPLDYFDSTFMSNFLEHCRTREQVLAVLSGVYEALKPGGCVLILGPNFRCCPREYYDFFDHHLALTEKSVAEALELAGFNVEVAQPRTLPFTFRSRLPSWPWLVWLYLQLPWLWRFFGAQFFSSAGSPRVPIVYMSHRYYQPRRHSCPADRREACPTAGNRRRSPVLVLDLDSTGDPGY
ncbi:MAG: SAM-dependent methyltransferase [Isosphaeraceae bacterium]